MIKGAKSIAEYNFRKWLQKEKFSMSEFELTVTGNTGIVKGKNGELITLIYDSVSKTVYVKG